MSEREKTDEGKGSRSLLGDLFTKIVAVLGGVALVVSSIYGFSVYVRTQVRNILEDDKFIKEIATRVRPSVIFDEKGSILANQGAMQYLDSIKVTVETHRDRANMPVRIVVSPKQLLSYPPIIESLNFNSFVISEKRGEQYNWIYTMQQLNFGETEYRFRLEIVK